MSAVVTWRCGLARVGRAPTLVALLWVLTLLVAVPPAVALRGAIAAHLGDSLEADAAADGVNADWMHEFRAASGALGRSLRLDVIGAAPILDNTSALVDGTPRPTVVALSAAAFVVLLWFVSPGALARLSADRPLGPRDMAAACGQHAAAMLRVGLAAVIVYGLLFGAVHQFLFDDVYGGVTADVTVERRAFAVRVGLYVVFVLMLALVNLLFDLARVRLVVERRHSALVSLAAAIDFIRTRPGAALGPYALNVAAYGAVVAAYVAVVPGVGPAGWQMWAAFLLGQTYLVARLAVKLAFWASQIVAVEQATPLSANRASPPAP